MVGLKARAGSKRRPSLRRTPTIGTATCPAARTSTARSTRRRRIYPLAQRELDVARLLVQGRSKSVIGERLGLSASTVRTHGRHLYAKLDVHSRQQLIDLLEELAGADEPAAR